MISMQLAVTTRLTLIKNTLSLLLILTIALTWPLWITDRMFPLFPGLENFSSVHILLGYALPSLLIFSLLMNVILVRPRFFIFLSVILCGTLMLLDAGRMQYWFYFYLLVLLVLMGYNWRVDNINRYLATFNAIKIVVATVYLISALQHFQVGFIHAQWPAFIKPFERFWTPEQCAYLLRIAYAVPLIELFVAIGLFATSTRIAAICFALLLHLFSLVVICLQSQSEPAVICWHIAMMLFVLLSFAGTPVAQKTHGFSFGLYPAVILLLFGMGGAIFFRASDKVPQNKIDLMQSNHADQCIYLGETERNKLPFYLQSFAMKREHDYYRLSITSWALNETKIRQVLGTSYIMRLTSELNKNYGAESLVVLPAEETKNTIALK